jgi:RNA polymerase sigma factor (sigma-70 family)
LSKGQIAMIPPNGASSNAFRATLPQGEERLLLETVAGGDTTAFYRLYTIYLPVVHQYIGKYLDFSQPDVQEVAQEIFLKIWKKKETLIVIRHFDKFLFTVARNSMFDHFRGIKSGQIKSRALADNWVPPQYPAEEKVMTLEYRSLTEKALGQMPERRRRIFELRTMHELSLEEIAGSLNMSVSAVHQNLQKAVEFMRTYFRRHGMDGL